MQQATIDIEGMSCGHCVASVNRALGRLDGVEVQEVTVGSASVSYDPQAVTLEQIKGTPPMSGRTELPTGGRRGTVPQGMMSS